MPETYLVTLVGAAFVAALVLVYIIARAGVASRKEVAEMLDYEGVPEVIELLKKSEELAGVATALDVYQRVAAAEAAVMAYRRANMPGVFITVATGTSPNTALIVPVHS